MSDRDTFLAKYGHEGHITHILNNSIARNKFMVLKKNCSVNDKHIGIALKDSSSAVRQAAVCHPNATKKNLETALGDDDIGIKREATIRLKELNQ